MDLQKLITKHHEALHETTLSNLLDRIDDNPYILLGEASHGTHEFYHIRAVISQLLIEQKGFRYVAIEGDWPATYAINKFIRSSTNESPHEALAKFKRFPAWMWRNEEIVQFITWLKDYNKNSSKQVSMYGLDLYSLHESISAVIESLEKIDPSMAAKAKQRYNCFDRFIEPQEYGYFTRLYPFISCRDEVIAQLIDLRVKDVETFKHDNLPLLEEKFYIEQNAFVVHSAEEYYRTLFEGTPVESWNVRDTHMMNTFNSVIEYGKHFEPNPKIIVWAHNSHLGDARATQRSDINEINLGQLIRESYGKKTYSIGFTTYSGTVSAASGWGKDVERKNVRRALVGSIEHTFHKAVGSDFILYPQENDVLAAALNQPMLERAIGVIYLPETERLSHYFYARVASQFNAVIHIDTSHAVVPLESTAVWQMGELPETYPSGE